MGGGEGGGGRRSGVEQVWNRAKRAGDQRRPEETRADQSRGGQSIALPTTRQLEGSRHGVHEVGLLARLQRRVARHGAREAVRAVDPAGRSVTAAEGGALPTRQRGRRQRRCDSPVLAARLHSRAQDLDGTRTAARRHQEPPLKRQRATKALYYLAISTRWTADVARALVCSIARNDVRRRCTAFKPTTHISPTISPQAIASPRS